MAEPKNIQLPYEDFKLILDTMSYIDPYNYAEDFRNQLFAVKNILQEKQNKIETREAYTKLVVAKGEDNKHNARMDYLQKKNEARNFEI